MLKPLGDRVVLQVEEAPEQSVGGILLASNAQEKSVTGTVVAVSTQSVGDLTAPVAVKEGDKVIFDKYAGSEVTVDGVDYLVVHEKDIVAVL
ncbi:GroES family chaperonin [Weissella confusa]|uniref:GroES family chaperonin n=1 Tax=Weissella confusa TaxID=1583 RepID=UPI0018F130F2|nr:co-chaperone GroES [Weissella confusa]MBJ7648610.1 co-chaperone GroES [Weissella confusa]MBJ7660613.1 co-chaperone GroES [Weissella confusa]